LGGITKCDQIALGIVRLKKKHKLKIPLIVRMTGTNEWEAKKILIKNNVHAFDTMEECARKIVKLTKK